MAQLGIENGFSKALLERRNKAFQILYDTLLEIQGTTEDAIIGIICKKLLQISNAKFTALATYDKENTSITLEAVAVESGEMHNPAMEYPQVTVNIPQNILDRCTGTQIQVILGKHSMIQALFPGSIERMIGTTEPDNTYNLSIVRDKELIAIGMAILPPYQKFDTRDMIDTFLNTSGIVMQRLFTARALRENEKKYRTVVEQGNDGIVITQDSRIKYTNPRFAEITGYSSKETSGKILRDFLQPDKSTKNKEANAEINGTECSSSFYEAALRHKDGRRIEVECNASIIPFLGKPAELVFVRDVTERKMMQSHIAQMQKLEAIGTLGAGVAHEINTPLQYISGNVKFLQDSFNDINKIMQGYLTLHTAAKKRSVTQDIITGIEKAIEEADLDFLLEEIPGSIEQSLDGLGKVAEIVLAMKEFSQVETKELVGTNINKCIENTVAVSKGEWKDYAEIIMDLDATLPLIPAHPGELNQVILNIIVNAAYAIREGCKNNENRKGTITIKTRLDNGLVEINICDTGAGIPEAIRPKIFEPFFTTKDVGTGIGQGLAIAYSIIVDKHGGTIDFESEVGAGTTFIIRLHV